ncbi:efflux RND transporter permease subunit [Vibrio owensii]|uniref:efflux RND transporter permease subunit n=1 Tax=Vibrio owensii TaxID=696485 RepID=UPI000586F07E|nr:efflux RND transporter permease subunit [Vibrio owensii]
MVALFILPAHLGRMKDKPKGKIGQKLDNWQCSVDRRLQHFIHQMYKPALQSVINRKYLSLSVVIAVMVLFDAWLASGRLGFYLMPHYEVNGVRVVGAILGHMLLGHPLSIISILGVIALCGVVVNDSLMLITTYNRNRVNGETWREAIVNAATRRFRPIFLTTATAFCGLAPMIFETSKEGQLMISMAISLGFDILFATVITLVIIPCMLGVGQDIRQWLSPKSIGAITNQRVCNE